MHPSAMNTRLALARAKIAEAAAAIAAEVPALEAEVEGFSRSNRDPQVRALWQTEHSARFLALLARDVYGVEIDVPLGPFYVPEGAEEPEEEVDPEQARRDVEARLVDEFSPVTLENLRDVSAALASDDPHAGLVAIDGIGDATANKILEFVKAEGPQEDEE